MCCVEVRGQLVGSHFSLLTMVLGVGSLGTLVGLMGNVSDLVLAHGGMVRPRIQGLLFLTVRILGSAHRFDFNLSVHCLGTC